ncbi:MAG: phytanoyl-CoA hydroxylase [Candidatus Azotimanducaceae bacterium]|jgi:phytanoyl-CoA hydroxylase
MSFVIQFIPPNGTGKEYQMNSLPNDTADYDKATFNRDGFLIKKNLASATLCDALKSLSLAQLEENLAPIEYEVDVQYPGSPISKSAEGGDTCRRLLHVYARDKMYREWATNESVKSVLLNLFRRDQVNDDPSGADDSKVMLSQCHHNCVMTKQPGFSSATLWHQDNRYWSFDEQNLISVWLAVGDETKKNGCLRVIPGTHSGQVDSGRFDAALFLRPDLPANKALISQSQPVELEKGDVLFFHSKLFHAAGRNLSQETKFSLVYSYHQASNQPISGTRSGRFPSIAF